MLLASCASAPQKAVNWARVDAKPINRATLEQTLAVCRAEAIAAGARYGSYSSGLEAFAQTGYGMPSVDFSPLGNLGNDYQAAADRRRRIDLQDSMIRSAMSACMARSGYIEG
jgi:hypothetical protein